MTSSNRGQEDTEAFEDRDIYVNSGEAATNMMATRSAKAQADFLLPYLEAGMDLLDCGCGPGSITLDLAELLSPGFVQGIDLEKTEIDRAKASALARNVAKVGFSVADVYDLPYEDDSFDAVFANTVIEHLSRPLDALMEMNRVLKPGGVIGVRDADWGGYLMEPYLSELEELFTLRAKVWQHHGGDPYLGRKLTGLFRSAGFLNIAPSATYDVNIDGGTAADWANSVFNWFNSDNFTDQVVNLGWCEKETIQTLAESWKEWGQHPDAFFARAYCEAVGWKE